MTTTAPWRELHASDRMNDGHRLPAAEGVH
jgi:hypothetical protein